MKNKVVNVEIDTFISTMSTLSIKYHRIIMVNIEDDTYVELLSTNAKDKTEDDSVKSFSDSIKRIMEKGVIHPEDREEFCTYMDGENLKKLIAEKKNQKSFRYRRIVDSRMRWVSVEIMPESGFGHDSNNAIIFVRDISQDYLGVIKNAKSNSTGMLFHFKAVVDEERSYSKILAEVADGITDKITKDIFMDTFGCDNLKKSFRENRRQVDMDIAYLYLGKKVFVHTTVYLVMNEYTNELECIMNGVDTSERYISERLPRMLYEKKYEIVAIVDLDSDRVSIKEYSGKRREYEEEYDYSDYINKATDLFIKDEEQSRFLEKTSKEKIINGLSQSETYEFSIYYKGTAGETRLKRYVYRYFDKITDLLLVTVEDITELFERDMLTNGSNRKGFVRKVAKVFDESYKPGRYAILYYNLNNFKAYNEMFGLSGGDEILRFMYESIVDSKLEPIAIARLEADHFVCLIKTENLDYDVVVQTCEKLFNYKNKVITLSAKCGIYIVEDDSMEIMGMCDRAKLAKKYIQDEYLKPYEIFDKSMNEQYLDKSEVLSNINRAFEKGEIKPYFQPVFDADTGEMVSAEALVRWVNPEKGIISPGIFIPALEETGHISKIDAYMETKVREFLEKRKIKGLPIIPISINLSWMDLYDDKMMEKIIANVKNSGLDDGTERFEVTETSYAAMCNSNENVLDELKLSGAKLYLDDFGSGFSSFSTVRDYDFDIIKLDMGFVQKITSTDNKVKNIIQSIIDMAHNVNAKVIAEGVEVQEQIDFLKSAGCDYMQGYYYSRPLPQEEFEQLLDNSYI